jgi:hypothetical protein
MYIPELKTRRAKTKSESHDTDDTIRRSDVTTRFPYLTPQQLAQWAYRKIGPHYWIVGRDAVYRVRDIHIYVKSIAKRVEPVPRQPLTLPPQKRKHARGPQSHRDL